MPQWGGILLLFSEFALRKIWGLGNAPLYREDNEYEYIVQPNQDGWRFGHHYHYNSYSQRCEEPDSTKTIVLGLGDSVIFGGAQTDNDSLATTLFSNETGIQMLNISAGSWGPDNCAAYLKKHGLFGAKAMWLLVSSHDAHDNIDHEKVVGENSSYPANKYLLAWGELFGRYVLPRLFKKEEKDDPDAKVLKGIRKNGQVFNPGFDQLNQMANSAGIPLYVCLHPETSEICLGRYNEQGQEIIQWCASHSVKLIKEIDEGITPAEFRDNIHLNERGQRFEANLMKKYIKLE
jgi:hypothetical protein